MIRFLMIAPALAVGLAASAAAQQVSEQDARQAGKGVLDAWNKTELQKDAVAHAASKMRPETSKANLGSGGNRTPRSGGIKSLYTRSQQA